MGLLGSILLLDTVVSNLCFKFLNLDAYLCSCVGKVKVCAICGNLSLVFALVDHVFLLM